MGRNNRTSSKKAEPMNSASQETAKVDDSVKTVVQEQAAAGQQPDSGAQGAGDQTTQQQPDQSGEGSGDVTTGDDSAKAEQTPEPTPEPKPEPDAPATPEPALEPTSAPASAPVQATDVLRQKTDFEQYIDAVRANASPVLLGVLDNLINYQNVMSQNTVMSNEVITQQQGVLWRSIRTVLNSADDFEHGFQLLINFARQYRETGAFQHHLLFRGFDYTKMNAETSKAFQKVLAIITAAAEHKSRSTVTKTIDLARAMEGSVFTDEARSRVIGFFN